MSRSGFERSITAILQELKYTSCPQARDIRNPKGFIRKSVYKIVEPYDVSGTATMLWSYQDLTEDQNFAYVPSIRRVRRTSPASRSDALFGSDFTVDDLAMYEGKIPDMEWKLAGTCDAYLVPYLSKDPIQVLTRPDGSYVNKDDHATPVYGYQVEGWKGAPWAPTNCIWVKRKLYLIDVHSKNPYYNYGKQLYWFDARTQIPVYKVVYDRTGKHWKTLLSIFTAVENEDKTWGHLEYAGSLVYDVRADHARITKTMDPENKLEWNVPDINPDMFSLAGFARFCK